MKKEKGERRKGEEEKRNTCAWISSHQILKKKFPGCFHLQRKRVSSKERGERISFSGGYKEKIKK